MVGVARVSVPFLANRSCFVSCFAVGLGFSCVSGALWQPIPCEKESKQSFFINKTQPESDVGATIVDVEDVVDVGEHECVR